MKGDSSHSAVRRFWRTVIVVGLAGFVLGTTQPNMLAPVLSRAGTFGLAVDDSAVVTSVSGGLPAAQVGLEPGDRLMPFSWADRFMLFFNSGPVGYVARTSVVHDGQTRNVVLKAVPRPAAGDLTVAIVKRLTALAFILTGVILVLRRPSRMTWGLFLFSLWGNGEAAPFILIGTPAVYATAASALGFVYNVGILGLWMFAARFPNDAATGWRGWIDRGAPWLAFGLAVRPFRIPLYAFAGVTLPPWLSLFAHYFGFAVIAAGIVVLLAGYFLERGDARQRIKWVVTGLAVALFFGAAENVLTDPHVPLWPTTGSVVSPDILFGTFIVVPITLAYAVLRHRVIDVRFAISRAIVYGVLTSLIVGLFAFTDWFFHRKLSTAGLGTVAEIGMAVAVGFWFNALHRRVDTLVDGVFFRSRRDAEKRLALAAAALPHAASVPAAAEMLAAEPVHAQDLTSGATFVKSDDGGFKRVFAIGWNDECTAELTADDLLVSRLKATRGPLSLDGVYWPSLQSCPDGAAAPALALPVFVREQLWALALLGAHAAGEAFDSDELRSLGALSVGAGAAFDHLEAESRRIENESLRKTVEQLQAQLREIAPGKAAAAPPIS